MKIKRLILAVVVAFLLAHLVVQIVESLGR
jgi:hypothetical protein